MKMFDAAHARVSWIVAGSLVVAVLAWRLWPNPTVVGYETAPVERRDIENHVLATGTLQPIRQVDVGTRVTGQLKSLKVKLGDHVQQGQILAEIDPTLPENELRAAQANLAKLEAQRAAAIAAARRSQLEFSRQEGMIERSATSRRDFEGAQAQALSDKANIVSLDAQIAEAKSRADIASANLAYTRILAPIEGDVVVVLTQEGQTVVAAQVVPVILELAQLDAMTVRTQVSEADVIEVKAGQSASFTIMGDPVHRYVGTVRAVELAPQNYSESLHSQSGARSSTSSGGGAAIFYNALFDVPNHDRRLRIGMTAQVSITIGVKNALTIPATALRDQEADGRYAIRILDASDRVESRLLRIGINNHTEAEVLDGAAEGERIIVSEKPASAVGRGNSRR